MEDDNSLEDRLGHTFKDKTLLELALTHRSVLSGLAAGKIDSNPTNERLEFLGDRVLGLSVAHLLFKTFEEEPEGQLAQRFAALVSAKTLQRVARDIELSPHIKVGTGLTMADAIESDACEALIGAVYLDAGFEAAQAVVVRHWQPLMDAVLTPPKDAKTALQEWVQERGQPLPVYELVDQTGPDHAPEFTISVNIEGYPSRSGTGSSKQAAAQAAAEMLMESLG